MHKRTRKWREYIKPNGFGFSASCAKAITN